jgi:hypothetical protein
MPLSTEQINLISSIDQKVKNILSSGGNEASVMVALLDEMPKIKIIIGSANQEELNKYCDSHEGFYQYTGLGSNGTANRLKVFLLFLMTLTHHVLPHLAWRRNIDRAY